LITSVIGAAIDCYRVDGRAIGSSLTVSLNAVSGLKLIAADVPALLAVLISAARRR
jgi:hypothetical protein